jgi:Flp pilus assembly pilin Flp
MKRYIQRIHKDNQGAALVEYAVLLGLISVVAWGALSLLGNQTNALVASIATCNTQTASTTTPNGIAGVISKGLVNTNGLVNKC